MASLMMTCGSTAVYATTVDSQTPSDALPATGDSSWSLSFSDEFNGSNLDLTKWQKDESTKTRSPRWDRGIADWWFTPDNVSLDGAGNLVLAVTKEDHNTMRTGSVSSINLYEPTYGYFEARVQIADSTKDTHTAFWLQSQNQSNVDGTANDGAEVDIFESAWFSDTTKAVVHIDGYGADHQASTKGYKAPGMHSGYHTFGVEWNEHVMSIYYDGLLKTQYEGIWVPQVAEFLWLSDGASFGDIGTFASEPLGLLTSAKFDYVRVWQQSNAMSRVIVGANKMNGNFNSEAGASVTYDKTPGWTNLAGDQYQVATKANVAVDGTQNLMVTSTRIAGLNSGYEMVEGDSFDISYDWADNWNWKDGLDKVSISLFVTSDNTLAGTRTNLVTDLSELSSINDSYESVDHDAIYTATAEDAGKVVFVAITSTNTGFARFDNFELVRHSAIPPNNAPVINETPINRADAIIGEEYSGTIANAATDADGDLLTYSLESAPTWLTVASDGTLSGTPTEIGPQSWTIAVTDGMDTTTEQLNITAVEPEPIIPTVLFSDDFETGDASAWIVSGKVLVNRHSSFDGKYGLRLKHETIIDRFISTEGYSNITLSYAREAQKLNGKESLRVRWKVQGTDAWHTLETVYTTPYATVIKELPALADNTNIVLRFVINTNRNKEKAYLDNIVVKGE